MIQNYKILCSRRKMCTFAAQIAQTRFNEHEFRIYIAPFPAYLLAILSMAKSEWRESAGHCLIMPVVIM